MLLIVNILSYSISKVSVGYYWAIVLQLCYSLTNDWSRKGLNHVSVSATKDPPLKRSGAPKKFSRKTRIAIIRDVCSLALSCWNHTSSQSRFLQKSEDHLFFLDNAYHTFMKSFAIISTPLAHVLFIHTVRQMKVCLITKEHRHGVRQVFHAALHMYYSEQQHCPQPIPRLARYFIEHHQIRRL